MYYDPADRLTDSVDVGTNGGVVWARPSTVPTGSDTVLVNHTDYNSAGWVLDTVDPRNIKAGTFYDLLGRTTETVAAWDGTSNPTPANSTNQITTDTYDGDNNVLKMTAVMPSGTNNQITAWVYGVGVTIGADLFSNDLVATVEYPDKALGTPSSAASDDQSMTYNWAGEKTSFTDQNQTTHDYSRDVLGRVTLDAAHIAPGNPQGMDTSILSLGYSFDDAGRPFRQSSYSDLSGATIVNQVQDAYNGYGQLTTEYQSHSGAVVTGTTLSVDYAYSQPSGTNYSRMSSMKYPTSAANPNGRMLNWVYNSGLDTTISRVSALADAAGSGAGTDEAYSYLGLDTIVRRIRPGSVLSYVKASGSANGDAGDQYTGLDRFGRVVDQNWVTSDTINGGTGGDSLGIATDNFQYAYDRNGNVLYKNNLVKAADSELYHVNGVLENSSYDSLNRLGNFSRGTLSASGTNGTQLDQITTASATNNWTLDALGNWSNTKGGTQTRTFNSQNQITGISGSTTPTYDSNGNTTTDETGKSYVFDAWNRITAVKSGGSVLTSYANDAFSRRIVEAPAGATPSDEYFNTSGNVIEERQGSTVTRQNVWSVGQVNTLVLSDDNSTSGNLGITGSGLGRRVYLQQDANLNVTSAVLSTGAVQERYIYDPYGSVTVLNPDWSVKGTGTLAASTLGPRYLWQGGRIDAATGLAHFGTVAGRDVSTTLGRPLQADNGGGYADGANLYQWEGSGPATYVDPSGLGHTKRVEPPEGFGDGDLPPQNLTGKGRSGKRAPNSALEAKDRLKDISKNQQRCRSAGDQSIGKTDKTAQQAAQEAEQEAQEAAQGLDYEAGAAGAEGEAAAGGIGAGEVLGAAGIILLSPSAIASSQTLSPRQSATYDLNWASNYIRGSNCPAAGQILNWLNASPQRNTSVETTWARVPATPGLLGDLYSSFIEDHAWVNQRITDWAQVQADVRTAVAALKKCESDCDP